MTILKEGRISIKEDGSVEVEDFQIENGTFQSLEDEVFRRITIALRRSGRFRGFLDGANAAAASAAVKPIRLVEVPKLNPTLLQQRSYERD